MFSLRFYEEKLIPELANKLSIFLVDIKLLHNSNIKSISINLTQKLAANTKCLKTIHSFKKSTKQINKYKPFGLN